MPRLCIVCAILAVLLSTANLVAAQPTPTPAPQAPHTIARSSPFSVPAKIDPCGGPLELENKLAPTACVFPSGEAMIQGAYQSINVPGSSQGPGPLGKSFQVPLYAHVFGYPASVVYVGVTPRIELDITPPSFAQVNSSKFGTLAAGALDTQFSYKQLFYIDLKTKTLMAIKLTYKPPTGSHALRGAGPAYQINPIIGHRIGSLFGLTLGLPVNNTAAPTPSGGVQRGWSFSPKLIAYWQSSGGTVLMTTVQHSFSPNVTPISYSVQQLLDRHMLLQVQYGGFNFDSLIAGLTHTTVNAYPQAIFLNVYYLIGRSDRPTQSKPPASALR